MAGEEMRFDQAHIKRLSERLYRGITSRLEGVVLNGDDTARCGNLSLWMKLHPTYVWYN